MTVYLLYMTILFGDTVHTTVTEHTSLEACHYAAKTHSAQLKNTAGYAAGTKWAYRIATTCARK